MKQDVWIPVGEESVSGLLLQPAGAKALYLFAHGAGTNMTHRSMQSNAEGFAERAVATLRYNFLYTERGGKRPDSPKLAHAAVRAAAAMAVELAPDLPLFAGGRSFGGRMTSQAQAEEALPGVRGLVFLGFPLHPAGKPGGDRAEHLAGVGVPMLFVSGTRDALAELELLEPAVAKLGDLATLHLVDQADHSFRVAAKSGRTNDEAEADALNAAASWMLSQTA
jgi:predicted alpha/beta-hydrolase family hydrolase